MMLLEFKVGPPGSGHFDILCNNGGKNKAEPCMDYTLALE